jgi:hypothetical protein
LKIYVIAISLLIFSGVVTLYNELGIFDQKMYEPGYTVNQSDISSVYQVSSGGDVKSSSNWIDDITGGLGFIAKIMGMVWKLLGNALNFGSLFTQYVPGVVGEQIGLFITTITYFVYAWGGIQLWQKVSSKNMD